MRKPKKYDPRLAILNRRLGRRALLRGAMGAGVGLTALYVVGCGDDAHRRLPLLHYATRRLPFPERTRAKLLNLFFFLVLINAAWRFPLLHSANRWLPFQDFCQ